MNIWYLVLIFALCQDKVQCQWLPPAHRQARLALPTLRCWLGGLQLGWGRIKSIFAFVIVFHHPLLLCHGKPEQDIECLDDDLNHFVSCWQSLSCPLLPYLETSNIHDICHIMHNTRLFCIKIFITVCFEIIQTFITFIHTKRRRRRGQQFNTEVGKERTLALNVT